MIRSDSPTVLTAPHGAVGRSATIPGVALPPIDPTKAVVLARVSSAEQADGYGLASQLTDCRRFAAAEGLEIVATFEEDARSTVLLDEREGGRAALDAMLRLGAGVLLLARRDRLARDPFVAGHAERAVGVMGARILYAEGGNGRTDSDLLLGDIQHAIAAHERRAIVARLAKGREEKAAREGASARAQGGRLPYGYRRDGRGLAEVDPEAAEVVRLIFTRAREGKSSAKIAKEIGKAPTFVDRVITREIYKTTELGRIVDPRIWNDAQAARARRLKR